ncbi:MAG TPA: sugar phosphate isomerase/epimerase [Mycobacteriales bacterium]|jgi:sugar phosphate isomerase/epimerase|nr:sugar phosphate isomerase/epimerase [Mycobacteriales bacterium]
MRLGIFTTVFPRDTVEAAFDAIGSYGLTDTQFDLAAVAGRTLPDDIPDGVAARVRRAATDRGLRIAGIEGTFNMAHPDPAHRADGLRRFGVLAAACRDFGGDMLTLCTGTRDPDNMWRRHPDNTTPEAWRDMRGTVEAALDLAAEHDLVLGVEPEISNVVSSPTLARRLLDEMDSPRLKIIFDGANLFDVTDPERRLDRADDVFRNAADLLGPDIALAHAKDVNADGTFAAVAEGDLPWPDYVRTLRQAGFFGSLVMHGLAENQAGRATSVLRELLPDSGQ